MHNDPGQVRERDKLFRKVKGGDGGALYDLLESERGEVYDYMMRMTGQVTRSTDTVDEVFQSLSEGLIGATASYLDLKTLLFTTARKFNADIWSADTTRLANAALEGTVEGDGTNDKAVRDRQRFQRIDKSLRTLAAPQREAAILCARHRFDFDRSATIMGLPVRDVEAHARAGLLRIASEVTGLEGAMASWLGRLPSHPPPPRSHHGTMNLGEVMQGLRTNPVGIWSPWRLLLLLMVIGIGVSYHLNPKAFERLAALVKGWLT